MKYRKRFEAALRSEEPFKALKGLVFEFSAEGKKKAEIYSLFEEYILFLREEARETEEYEELLMEVMDSLTGWSHPDAQIKLPVFLEKDVAEYIQNYAIKNNVEADIAVNQLLRSNIAAMQ